VKKPNRAFSAEFRAQLARRILEGESVSKLHHEFDIKRSVLYRWRDSYRKAGAAGLVCPVGRPATKTIADAASAPAPGPGLSEAESLRRQIAVLERKVGQQELQLDFFKKAFKRVKESSQTSGNAGETASTRRSGQ
jgi:transposase